MREPAITRSPVHKAIERLNPEWDRIGTTPVALHLGDPSGESALRRRLALCDASSLKRFGVKGPDASRWLEERGIDVPEKANSWTTAPDGRGLVARLGRNEFLVEDSPEGSVTDGLGDVLDSSVPGIYPVLRQDAAFVLAGGRSEDVMRQVCGVDFDSLDQEARPVVLTRVAIISAVVLPQVQDGIQIYRIWCDAPYGMYLWEEISAIVVEFGGGVVGLSAMFSGG